MSLRATLYITCTLCTKCGYDRRWSRTSLRLSLSPTLLHHPSHERRRTPPPASQPPHQPISTTLTILKEAALRNRLQASFYLATVKRRRDIAVGKSHPQRLGRGDFAPWWGTPDKNNWRRATLEHVIAVWEYQGLSIHVGWTVGHLPCDRKSIVTANSWPVTSGPTSKQGLHR